MIKGRFRSGCIPTGTGLFWHAAGNFVYVRLAPICILLYFKVVIYSYITWIIVNYKTWTKVI